MDVLGTVALLRAVELERVVEEAAVHVFHHMVGHFEAPAVDGAAAGDAYVALLHREHERRPFAIRVLDVVPGVEGAEQGGAGFQMQGDVVLEVDAAAEVHSGGEDHPAASVCAHVVDGRLDAGAVERPSVRLCPEIRSVIVLRTGTGGQKQAERRAEDESEFPVHILFHC